MIFSNDWDIWGVTSSKGSSGQVKFSKNHPGSSLQKSSLGCSPKRSPRKFRRKLPSVQTSPGRSLKNTPEKFPRYFPGNPVDTVPIKKSSLKKPLHCSLKYPRTGFQMGPKKQANKNIQNPKNRRTLSQAATGLEGSNQDPWISFKASCGYPAWQHAKSC